VRLGRVDPGCRAESGVAEGMAVVSSDGLVGRILSSDRDIPDADPGGSGVPVSVLSTRSRNPGILHSATARVSCEFQRDLRHPGGRQPRHLGRGGSSLGASGGRVFDVHRTPANVLRNARVVPYQDPWNTRNVSSSCVRRSFGSAGFIHYAQGNGWNDEPVQRGEFD